MAIKVKIINQLSDNYSYIIYSIKSKKALVVDPAESETIIDFLRKNNLLLESLLITHHHADHTSGISKLLAFKDVKVYSPNKSILGTTNLVKNNDKIYFNFIDFVILATPGHTLDHVVLYSKNNNLLFSGDALFSLGCGRIFEGTYDQMFKSLQTLNDLPNDTMVYCGHEYTHQNFNFLNSVFKDNKEIKKYKTIIDMKLKKNECTIPFRLGDEKTINPFLNSSNSAYKEFMLSKKFDELNFFKYLRHLKDNF